MPSHLRERHTKPASGVPILVAVPVLKNGPRAPLRLPGGKGGYRGRYKGGRYDKNEAQQRWLESVIRQLGCVVGTVHVQRGEDLYLTAAQNIPPQVLAIVAHVPHGKGMAGAAQVKKALVQTCNLQDEKAGVRALFSHEKESSDPGRAMRVWPW